MLLMISTAESTSRHLLTTTCEVTCTEVVAVQPTETCYSISGANNLSVTLFQSLNPNLICEKLFPLQWVCIAGKPC
ncbi:hypothetical protein LINPERHAP1_LOCUS37340 [Linum perenne]